MEGSTQFKFVYIPADDSQPLEEWSLTPPRDKLIECLIERLKVHFGRSVAQNTDDFRAGIIKSIQEQSPGTNADERLVQAMMSMQTVDCVPLLEGRARNDWEVINMYVDDSGTLKGLPLNMRASQIAMECGKQLQVMGDAFIARIRDDNNDLFERVDFTLSEVSSDAKWVKLAKAAPSGGASRGYSVVTKSTASAPSASAAAPCANCGGPAGFNCSRCHQARYCSRDCQREHWKTHKPHCTSA